MRNDAVRVKGVLDNYPEKELERVKRSMERLREFGKYQKVVDYSAAVDVKRFSRGIGAMVYKRSALLIQTVGTCS